MTERLSVIQANGRWGVWDEMSQLLLCSGTLEECLRFKQLAGKQLELDLLVTQESVVLW